MEKTATGIVLEEQFVTTVCNPYLAPPSNHWLPDQARPLGNGFLGAIQTIPCGLPIQASFTGPGGLKNEESHAPHSIAVPNLYFGFSNDGVIPCCTLEPVLPPHVIFSFPPAWLSSEPTPNPFSSPPFTFDVYISYIFFFLFSQAWSSTFGISERQRGCYQNKT